MPMSTTLKRVQWSVVEGETLATVAQDGTVNLKDNATGGQVTVEAAATDGSGIRETVTLTAAPYTDEKKVKTKAKKATYIKGLHGSGAAKMKAEIRRKRANRHKK